MASERETKVGRPRSPKAGATLDTFDQLNEPGPLLRRCHQRSQDIYTAVLGANAPTRQQLAIMLAIYQLDEPTQAKVSARTGVDRNTIADVMRRLKKSGYIMKLPHTSDSRAFELRLTRVGVNTVTSLMNKVTEVQDQILAPLEPDLRSCFLRCLRIVAGVEKSDKIPQ